MNRFMPVSKETYNRVKNELPNDKNHTIYEYEELKNLIPRRSTTFSAGYDFYLPHDIYIQFDGRFYFMKSFTVYTGMRCQLDDDKVLAIFPRSGLSINNGIQLSNTVGIIDADYFNTKNDLLTNEGQIILNFKIHTLSKDLDLKKGTKIAQGIILPYYKTDDDYMFDKADRNGGFGSTGI